MSIRPLFACFLPGVNGNALDPMGSLTFIPRQVLSLRKEAVNLVSSIVFQLQDLDVSLHIEHRILPVTYAMNHDIHICHVRLPSKVFDLKFDV